MRGYVFVVLVGIENYSEDDYKSFELLIFIVYGEKDLIFGVFFLWRFRNIFESVIYVMKGVGYLCYMMNFKEFYENLFSFFSKL